jgi:hypothetical protein
LAIGEATAKLDLLPSVQEDVIMAQENVAAFKEWMSR